MTTRKRTRRNVTFLLGSGVSADLFPLTGGLNGIIMTGKDVRGRIVYRAGEGQYGLFDARDVAAEYPGWSARVRRFLSWLVRTIKSDDYELLFFVCRQIDDDLTGEFPNPPLRSFIRRCLPHVREWWGVPRVEFDADPRSLSSKLQYLAWETQNYIGGSVAAALQPMGSVGKRLDRMHAPLLAACRDTTVGFVDILSLNHDTLFEASFSRKKISVEDGFGKADDRSGLAMWEGYKLRDVPTVRLIKLHGSIDEWPFPSEAGRVRIGRVAGYPFRIPTRSDTLLDTPAYRPGMLVGTTNKMLEYLRATNIDRFAVFRRSLIRSGGLVIAGYGLRDKGVNQLLIEWCWSRRRRVVVVDPYLQADGATAGAGAAIRDTWQMLRRQERLFAFAKAFKDVTWPTLRGSLFGRA